MTPRPSTVLYRGFLVTTHLADGERVRRVWEPTTSARTHGVVCFARGLCWGQVGTRSPPIEVSRLPPEERGAALACWVAGQSFRARTLLARADLVAAARSDGGVAAADCVQ